MGANNSTPQRHIDTSRLKKHYTEREINDNINRLLRPTSAPAPSFQPATSIDSIGFNQPTVASSIGPVEDRAGQQVQQLFQTQTAPTQTGGGQFQSRRQRYEKYTMDRIVAQKGGALSETQDFEMSHDLNQVEEFKRALEQERRNYRESVQRGGAVESPEYQPLPQNLPGLNTQDFLQKMKLALPNTQGDEVSLGLQTGGADSEFQPLPAELPGMGNVTDALKRAYEQGINNVQTGGDGEYQPLPNNIQGLNWGDYADKIEQGVAQVPTQDPLEAEINQLGGDGEFQPLPNNIQGLNWGDYADKIEQGVAQVPTQDPLEAEINQLGGDAQSPIFQPLPDNLPGSREFVEKMTSMLQDVQYGGFSSDTTPNRFSLEGGARKSRTATPSLSSPANSPTSALEFSFGDLPEFSRTSRTNELMASEGAYDLTSNQASSEYAQSPASSYVSSPMVSSGQSPIELSQSESEINTVPFYNTDSSSELSFRMPETKSRF